MHPAWTYSSAYEEFQRNVKTSVHHSEARAGICAINENTDYGAYVGVAVSTELVRRYKSRTRLWSFRALLDATEREVNHGAMTQVLRVIASG